MAMKLQKAFFSAGDEYADFAKRIPAPALRYSFNAQSGMSAKLEICAPGFYELFLNGERITDGRLRPFIANPDDILYYDEYDLASRLADGENVIGILLGNGVIDPIGGGVWDFDKAEYRAAPCFALSFSGERGDTEINFDASIFRWHDSPIVFNDLRCGEWYDARSEIPGWNLPGYDDSGWLPVTAVRAPRGKLRKGDYYPIEVTRGLKPVSITKSHIGIYPNLDETFTPPADSDEVGWLYDFGVNISGVCRLKLKNTRKGQRIVMQFGEIKGEKNPDGLTDRGEERGLDLRGFHYLPHEYNNRDVYICRGDDNEEWTPEFTYHGFRYCLVFGLDDDQVGDDTLTCLVMNTKLTERAELYTSNDMVNRIWDATKRSDLANFFHFPTDCPHREKNGWTGDAMLSADQFMLLFDAEKNLSEWLVSLRAAQFPDVSLPGIVPTSGWGVGFGPAWDGVIVELPYRIWLYTGDTKVINDNSDAIFRYLKYLCGIRNREGIILSGLGDWCQSARKRVDIPKAPSYFTYTLIACDSADKAAKLFAAIGATEYQKFAESLRDALHSSARKKFIRSDCRTVTARCQTAQAMAIYYGLFEPAERPAAFSVLLDLINENDGSFDCGVLGMRVLFHVLSEFGQTELALKMITKPDFPSYGYWFENGATSLWELMTPITGTQSSCNHHFFGDVAAWFLKSLSGIKLNPYGDDPDRVLIEPKFVSDPDHVTASLNARSGKIRVEWKRSGGHIFGDIVIPDGMRAELLLPEGWQTSDGFTIKQIKGTCHFDIIRSDETDEYKYSV